MNNCDPKYKHTANYFLASKNNSNFDINSMLYKIN